jgi:indole-3-glycerol phosphate synthase
MMNMNWIGVDTSSFQRILPLIPDSIIKVAESGISDVADVRMARRAGADAILVGESLVRSADPGSTIQNFIAGADT